MPNNLLDLESVRCFLAAARSGASFRSAAKSLHLSPPAFSDRIRRLEQDVGVALFERTTRRVSLTDAGHRFLGEAARLLDCEHAARATLTEAPTAPVPFEIVLGTRFELGMSWLVPNLDPLAAACPERAIHLYFGDSEDLLAQLHAGHIDALVTSARLSTTQLDYAPLHDETYVFVAAPLVIDLRPLRVANDARHHVLVDLHADLPLFRYFLDAAPPEPAWRFSRVERMGTIAAVRQRVLAGRGVGVLPEYFVERDLEAGRLVRVIPHQRLKQDVFRLLWLEGHRRREELRTLARQLAQLALA